MRALSRPGLMRFIVLGASARRRAPDRHAVTLGIATAGLALVLALVAVCLVWATYDQRAAVDRARWPVGNELHQPAFPPEASEEEIRAAEATAAGGAPFAARVTFDRLSDGLQHSVVHVVVRDRTSAPPPGLARWPEPGEAWLSPALARDGEAEGITSRYGKVVGTIGLEGLASPEERIAYANPVAGAVDMSTFAGFRSFGAPVADPWFSPSLTAFAGEAMTVLPAPFLLVGVALLLFVPAIILAKAARKVAFASRDSTSLMMSAIGVPRVHRRLFALGDFLPGFVVSLLGAGGLVALCATTAIRLPLTGFVLPLQAIRERLGTVVAIVALGVVAYVVCLTTPKRAVFRAVTAPSVVVRSPPPVWVNLITPACVVAASRIPSFLDPSGKSSWQFAYILFYTGALLGAHFLIESVIRGVGRILKALGRRRGNAAGVVSGAWLTGHARTVSALVATVVVFTGLLFQAMFVTNALQENARRALDVAQYLDGRLLVSTHFYGVRNLPSLLADLPVGTQTAVLTYETSAQRSVIEGSCDALKSLQLSCPPASVSALVDEPLKGDLALAQGELPLQPGRLDVQVVRPQDIATRDGQWLILSSPTDMDVAAIKQAVFRHSWPGAGPDTPFYGFLGSAMESVHHSRWIPLLGSGALLMFLLSVTIAGEGSQRRIAASLAPLLGVFGVRRVPLVVAALLVGMPLALSGVLAAGMGLVLAEVPIAIGLAPRYGQDLALFVCAACVTAGVVLALVATRLITRSAHTWKPG